MELWRNEPDWFHTFAIVNQYAIFSVTRVDSNTSLSGYYIIEQYYLYIRQFQ